MSGTSHFEVYEGKTEGDWRWRLLAANGEPVASGEGYTSVTDAERGAEDAGRAALLAQLAPQEGVVVFDVRRSEG